MPKLKRRRNIGIALAIILGALALLYLGGLVGQFLNAYSVWLAHGGLEGSVYMEPISFQLSKCFQNIFTPNGLKGILLVLLLVAASFAYITFRYRSKNKGITDNRNLKKSEQDTYGTASWMTEKIIKDYLEIREVKNTDGIILGMKDEKAVCLPKTSMLNRHIIAFGASGSMKSRSVVRPCAYQVIKRNESAIFLDPKSELYHDTANLFREHGYEVRVFNLKDPEYSDSCNFMHELNGDSLMAQILTDVIIKNTSNGKPDHFWDNGESNLLKALILYVSTDASRPDSEKNLPEVYKLICSVDEMQLATMFERLPLQHPAKAPYNLFKRATDSVRAGIISGLGTRLQVFQSEKVNRIISRPEIDLTAPGKKKCAYFIIVSDQQGTLDFLTALFFSLLFIKLVEYADNQSDLKCEIPVNIILEELNNCGVIPEFGRKISTARSRLISVVLIAQSIPQLQNRYPNNEWSELMGNCDTQLLLGCTEEITANYFSFRSGTMTVGVNSTMVQRKTMAVIQMVPEYRESSGVGKRPLLTPDEILRMPQEKVLIALRGQNVLRLEKFDYIYHEYAGQINPAKISDYRKRISEKASDKPETLPPVKKTTGESKSLYSSASPPKDF
jgi:Type IV secretory pathway, VirD4 components